MDIDSPGLDGFVHKGIFHGKHFSEGNSVVLAPPGIGIMTRFEVGIPPRRPLFRESREVRCLLQVVFSAISRRTAMA
jgi:hypothetical protein